MMPWLGFGEKISRRPLRSSTDIWSLGCVVLDMYLVREGQEGLKLDIDLFDLQTIRGHVYEGFPLIPQLPKDLPDELKVLAGLCLKINPDERPTAATLLNYVDRASLMLKAFDLQEITATAIDHDGNRSSSTFKYTFKDCFSDLKFGFRRIPAGYAHCFAAHGLTQAIVQPEKTSLFIASCTSGNHHSGFTLFFQPSPLLLFLGLSLLSSLTYTEPVYNLQQSLKYPQQYLTRNLDVRFYLKDDIHTKLTNKEMLTIETSVEELYLNNLKESCVRERAYKENVMWRGRLYGDHKLVQKHYWRVLAQRFWKPGVRVILIGSWS
ncbi:hypothetical protein BV898_04560 [Hypsibius exemplaris]|uniref:Protein kinase domain-containing protein n=1 Tax=Hypsibius exemplaris TaxID=2072580 RepID=A0A1W0X1Q7_HYPEX|nr:hypothetical protein BV898_04560 [Hypsibius exemplaris]